MERILVIYVITTYYVNKEIENVSIEICFEDCVEVLKIDPWQSDIIKMNNLLIIYRKKV